MAWYRIADNILTAMANAINAKTGKTAPLTPVEMVAEIQDIPTGGGGNSEIVTVGANTVSNALQAETYLKGLSTLDLSSDKYFIEIESGYTSPAYNQIGAIYKYMFVNINTMASNGIRYRDTSWGIITMTATYDAILVEGTSYKITVLE